MRVTLPTSWVHGLLGWKVTVTDESAKAGSAAPTAAIARAATTERERREGDMKNPRTVEWDVLARRHSTRALAPGAPIAPSSILPLPWRRRSPRVQRPSHATPVNARMRRFESRRHHP